MGGRWQVIIVDSDAEHVERLAAADIVQSTITNPDLDGTLIRDLRLPSDILILGIKRDGCTILPHDYTSLRLYDDMTLIGHLDSLDEVTVKLGY